LANEIISYDELCQREGGRPQRGMNFEFSVNYALILMSVQRNAPYADRIDDGGSTILYEGHDVPHSSEILNPKIIDQPQFTSSGKLTENGKFHKAVQDFKRGNRQPKRVRVYEKIKSGIWSYNGFFHLVDSWQEQNTGRCVFRFKLIAIEGEEDFPEPVPTDLIISRVIPHNVKLEVWDRDKGKCVKCGATKDLHFDHIIPWSKGGSSNTADNIQLLCGKHNLEKRDKIL
jgi:hypothetical protein